MCSFQTRVEILQLEANSTEILKLYSQLPSLNEMSVLV